RFWYMGPMFRAERPQAGRLREFVQVGVECLGNPHPAADAEAILAAKAVFEEAGLSGRTALRLNNLGCDDDSSCRPAHREALRAFLRSREGDLCENCLRRTARNPLRALDCKGCGPSLAGQAPRLIPCAACAGHVQEVSRFLLANGCPHRYPDHGLVRGLDYYTRTVFEFSSSLGTGSQDALAGGGRYDGLVGSMGGPKTPAVGWALGLERVLMAVRAARPDPGIPARGPSIDAFVALQGKGAGAALAAVSALEALRRAGLRAGGSAFGASLKAQMREASREEAPFVAIIGDEELEKTPPACTLKDMRAGTQAEVALGALADLLVRETRGKGE
ncbi:MAG: ATP phosphoribosyltransferase regulatory subunit, partial [Elusimicrobiota bacterium]